MTTTHGWPRLMDRKTAGEYLQVSEWGDPTIPRLGRPTSDPGPLARALRHPRPGRPRRLAGGTVTPGSAIDDFVIMARRT